MRMLSFEEFVIACEDDEPKTREEIEAKLNTLEQRGKELEEKKQDHLKKWDPYLDPNNKDVLRQNLSEEERKKVHELNEESLRLHEEIQDYNQERLRFQSYLMEWEINQTKNHLPVKPSEEEEISKLKKYGKYGLGVAAVGGLGYAGYKYLTRKKDSSNEGMLSWEEFRDISLEGVTLFPNQGKEGIFKKRGLEDRWMDKKDFGEHDYKEVERVLEEVKHMVTSNDDRSMIKANLKNLSDNDKHLLQRLEVSSIERFSEDEKKKISLLINDIFTVCKRKGIELDSVLDSRLRRFLHVVIKVALWTGGMIAVGKASEYWLRKNGLMLY